MTTMSDTLKGALGAALLVVVIIGFCDCVYRTMDFIVDIAAAKRCGR